MDANEIHAELQRLQEVIGREERALVDAEARQLEIAHGPGALFEAVLRHRAAMRLLIARDLALGVVEKHRDDLIAIIKSYDLDLDDTVVAEALGRDMGKV